MIFHICELLLLLLTNKQAVSCPLKTDSPCHCGIRNDSTSYIQCSDKKLLEVPTFVPSFSYDQLILTDNYISTVDDEDFAGLKVRQVFFTGNPISSVSHGAFGQLTQLEEIYVEFLNTVNFIPKTLLCRSPKLRVLSVKGARLNTVGICKNMSQLNSVAMVDCGLSGQLESINLPNLKNLDLSQNELKAWSQLPNQLKSLNLSHNRIVRTTQLPTNLIVLDLSNNGLLEWPTQSLCPLLKLTELLLDNNRIETLPSVLPHNCDIPNLQFLSLRHNRIRRFSPEKSLPSPNPVFVNLHTLDLSSNRLEHFDGIRLGANIEAVILEGNRLELVPQNLPLSLKRLDLSANRICSLAAASVKILARIEWYSLADNPFFCDCNLRAFQLELQRRDNNAKKITCAAPKSLKGLAVKDVRLQCISPVPKCVQVAHGPHLQPASDDGETLEVYVRYLPSPRRTILVLWEWDGPVNEDYFFRVSFELHSANKAERIGTIQLSSQLPSNARRFALQNAIADHVYTVCVIASDQKDHQRRCVDIYTAENEDSPFAKKWKTSNYDPESRLMILLISIIILVTVALAFVLALLIALIIRRRCETRQWKQQQKKHCHGSTASHTSPPECYHTTGSSPPNVPHRYCCSCCCFACCRQSSDLVDTETLNRHVYHEINDHKLLTCDTMNSKCNHHVDFCCA